MRRFIILTITLFSLLSLSAQTNIDAQFFNKVDEFLKKHVSDDRVDYAGIIRGSTLDQLVEQIGTANVNGLDENTLKAFYINAYNLLIIKGVTRNYPIKSVQDQGGFFETQKFLVAGKRLTLNQLENERLLKEYKDPRFHFVLVCGALGCPPITNSAYTPEKLEQQLETQTRKALNDPFFVRINDQSQEVKISEIFNWYAKDFGGTKESAIDYINSYRATEIPDNSKIGFYTYDWSINEHVQETGDVNSFSSKVLGNNASRYVVSAAIPKGSSEIKLFNNLYSQKTTPTGDGNPVDRSTFFTSNLSYLYGITSRFNLGFDARYRRVRNDRLPSSPFGVFGLGEGNEVSTRQGLTTLGPKIRWAPFPALQNFSIQSTLQLPLGKEFEGNDTQPFIDWNGATWWTQFFNDLSLGSSFSLFTEIDFLIEDFGGSDALNRISTPATVILSYFPTSKSTIYALSGYSPYWQQNYDYFAQLGVGAKYQINSKFELELLYTSFTNKFLNQNNGSASTFNFGIRVNR